MREHRFSYRSLWAQLTAASPINLGSLMLGFRLADATRGHPRIGKTSLDDLPEVPAEQDFAIELAGAQDFHGWHATILTHDGASFDTLCPSPDFRTVTVSDAHLRFPPTESGNELWLRYASSDEGRHWLYVLLTSRAWPEELATNLFGVRQLGPA